MPSLYFAVCVPLYDRAKINIVISQAAKASDDSCLRMEPKNV